MNIIRVMKMSEYLYTALIENILKREYIQSTIS